jgi:SAM-dependent methyltransferase
MGEELDSAAVERFAGFLMQTYTSAGVTLCIHIGQQTGLWERLAGGAATSTELADRSGLSERHVREWLAAVTCAGIVDFDETTRRFSLPAEHAACLTGTTSANLAPISGAWPVMGRLAPRLIETFHTGGGLPYSAYMPEYTDIQDAANRRIYDDTLVDGYLAAVDGLTERLRSGVRVADVGCGTGHCVNLMARAFPASTFVGYDVSRVALERARGEAESMGVTNVTFELQDCAALDETHEHFEVVTAFDVIHDLAWPGEALAGIAHLVEEDDGVFVMVDTKLSSYLENNLDIPTATLTYVSSLVHCMQVSLAQGGVGLGSGWGHEMATEMLMKAGFSDVHITETPKDPFDNIYVARR